MITDAHTYTHTHGTVSANNDDELVVRQCKESVPYWIGVHEEGSAHDAALS